MSKKIEFDKNELKRPDQFLQGLNTGFQWSAAHSKAVLTVLAILILGGGGVAVYQTVKHQTDEKLQEKFYQAEKSYLDLRKKFEDSQKAEAEKNQGADAKAQLEKGKGKTPPPAKPPVEIKPSSDPGKDYAEPIRQMKELISANPKSSAGLMAALTLTGLFQESKRYEEALSSIEEVTRGDKANSLLSALAFKTKGNLQATLNQCPEAVKSWEIASKSDKFSFIASDLKIKMALCYEKMQDYARAESLYTELASSKELGDPKKGGASAADVGMAKEAEKYLRLLKAKKENRGS